MTQNGDLNLPNSVTLADDAAGLTELRVHCRQGTGALRLQGAHVTEWVPSGHDPVLFCSEKAEFAPGKPIRGGVPLCGPWFGPGLRGDQKPNHGWFRTADWDLVAVSEADDGAVSVEMRLDGSTVEGGQDLVAYFAVTFGRTLNLALRVATGATPLELSEAFHPYFRVSDVEKITIEGLAGVTYVDQTDGDTKVQEGDVTFAGETDRVYATEESTVIVDPGLKRRVRLDKQYSASTVLWNPWAERAGQLSDMGDDEWRGMVCMEAGNALSGYVPLDAHQEHTMLARYIVEHMEG